MLQTWLLDKLKEHGPKILLFVLVLVAGIGIGWYVKPDVVKVEEKTKIVETKVLDEVLMEQEIAKRVKEIESHMEVKVVTKWVVKPDGTKETTETKETKTDTKEKETEDKSKETVKIVKEIEYKDKIVEKTVTPVLAQWHVGALVGVAPRFDSPATTPIMVGVEAERRIVGPVFLGVWAMAGSPVTTFNVTNAAIGLKVGFEF